MKNVKIGSREGIAKKIAKWEQKKDQNGENWFRRLVTLISSLILEKQKCLKAKHRTIRHCWWDKAK